MDFFTLILLILIALTSSKYILIELADAKADQQNRFRASNNFRTKASYPIEVPLKDRYAKTCMNDDLVKKGFRYKKIKVRTQAR